MELEEFKIEIEKKFQGSDLRKFNFPKIPFKIK